MLVFEGKFLVHPNGCGTTGALGVPTYARSMVGWRCLEHSVGKNAELGISDESWGLAQAAMELRMGSELVGKLTCGMSRFTEVEVERIEAELRVGAEKPVLPPPVEFVSVEELEATLQGKR